MSERITFAPIKAKRKVFLSGTPILNRPKELFTIAKACAPHKFSSYWSYATRYCAGHRGRFGFDDTGASNLEELQEILRTEFMVRRLKADVLKDLPAKRRQVVEFPANGAAAAIKHEQATMRSQMNALTPLRLAVELAKASDDPEEYKQAVQRLRDGASHAFQEIAAARRDTAIAKIPYVLEHLRNCSGKVIIFAHHKAVIDALMADLGDAAVRISGDTEMHARQRAVDRFQNDPSCLFFVGNIKAAGVGLTLTASAHVVFAELTYTPSDIQQAEDRAHRIGQRNSVLVQHLVLEGSIDANMSRAIVEKMGVIEKALDDAIELPDLTAPVLPDEPVTAKVTRKQVEQDAKTLTVAQIAAIQTGLQILAAMDLDHASQRNDMGFNRMDTEIGCSLAARGSLTPKQAALGAKLVNKYRRQLPDDIIARAKGE
jgi:SNF2 family DNA or RNA helicase